MIIVSRGDEGGVAREAVLFHDLHQLALFPLCSLFLPQIRRSVGAADCLGDVRLLPSALVLLGDGRKVSVKCHMSNAHYIVLVVLVVIGRILSFISLFRKTVPRMPLM